jgi:hypothetical protein
LEQRPVWGRKQNIGGVPHDDNQSHTKVERQGIIILLPAYFEDKLVVYQRAPIQEWQAT